MTQCPVTVADFRSRDEGYTLLEAIIVVAIVAMLMSAAPTVFSIFVPNFKARQFANDIANTARDLRRLAAKTQRVTTLRFDEDTEELSFYFWNEDVADWSTRTLDPPVTLSVEFAQEMDWATVDANTVDFYPSGGSSGGQFTVGRGGVSVEVDIDWVTGAVEVRQ